MRTDRGTTHIETYMVAEKEVLAKSKSLRKACAKYSVNLLAPEFSLKF